MVRTVLVIDGDPSVKKLLTLFLEENSFKALTTDFNMALEVIDVNLRKIDTVIINGDPSRYQNILDVSEKMIKTKLEIPVIILSSLFEERAPELQILKNRGCTVLVTLSFFLQDILDSLDPSAKKEEVVALF